MKLPKTFKVGRKRYEVQTYKRVGYNLRGIVYYGPGAINLSTHERDGTQREPKVVTQAFWHEVVHTILHDMGHKLNKDEDFVDGVAERLTQVVNTARF